MTAQTLSFPQRANHPIVMELVRAGMREPTEVMRLPADDLVIEVSGHDFYLRRNCSGFELRVQGEPEPRITLNRQEGAGDEKYSPEDLKAAADLVNQVSAEEYFPAE